MKTFQELGVREDIIKAITELGFINPMPIQEKVIPHLLNEINDIIALAQTGTGKTAAFGLPLLQRIDVETEKPQALIIAPTRELCLQIAGDLADYSKYIDDLRVLPVYGGSSIESQIKMLRRGVHIVHGHAVQLAHRAAAAPGQVRPYQQAVHAVPHKGQVQRAEHLGCYLSVIHIGHFTYSNSKSRMLTVSPSCTPISSSFLMIPLWTSTRWKYCSDS